ncbi:MAG: DEAD/DEAH box helicase [Bacilli bacterium]|nr:DEAD/DEAH box helicase [Bacilli bacterium]
MSFNGLSLSDKMVASLKKQGYVDPSPVQQNVIPKALKGRSVLAQSPTGSGKTHSFLIPLIEKCDMNLKRIQSIIIAPTRELARQIYDFARGFCDHFPEFKPRLYSSETDVSQNLEGVKEPPQMVIGTPGRLKDMLVDQGLFGLQNCKAIVLDEADMLLDLGYFEDIEQIFALLKNPQVLVFSATLRQDLKAELAKLVKNGFDFEGDENKTAETVTHHLIDVKHIGTNEAILRFLKIKKPYLCLVFASKKETVAEIHAFLQANGIPNIYFAGNLEERARKKAIREIKKNNHQVIVCSDLLSRGIDIPDVTDVVSVDLPNDLSFYFHRAGRAGRFGKPGDSWVFYNVDSIAIPRQLADRGVKFETLAMKGDKIVPDSIGLATKAQGHKKKVLPEDEVKEIKIAKALSRPKQVEPMYKKKQKIAIEKVKRKFRRKAIKKSVRKSLEKNWTAKAKKAKKITGKDGK